MEKNIELKHTEKIKLLNSNFDLNDRLKPTSIFELFQDVACVHGEQMGVGFEEMLEKKLFWVVSRVKYDVLIDPKVYQDVIIETWYHKKGRIDFDRDYLIKDLDGNVLVKGTSKWCVISTETRRLETIDKINYPDEYYPEVNYEERFVKTPCIEREGEPAYSHTVSYNEIDHNLHLNNVNYATYVYNALKAKEFSHFQLNFIEECKLGERLDVFVKEDENSGYLVAGYVDDKVKFSAYVKVK